MSNASFCLQQFNVLTRRIVLTVENTYAAVGELELNRLFDRFYRADKARKFTGGYSVGLSMAKAFDPGTNIQTSVSGKLFELLFIMYFFATDSHLTFIRIMASWVTMS